VQDARLLGGALTFKDRRVGEVMTPLNKVFSLPIDAVLDEETFLEILGRGHTRIPVYTGQPSDIVGLLFVKNLLGIGFERKLSLRQLLDTWRRERPSNCEAIRVPANTRLNVALDRCKQARVHMLVVTEATRDAAGNFQGGCGSRGGTPVGTRSSRAEGKVVGVVTLEDILEEILQEEIVDETDEFISNEASSLNPQSESVKEMELPCAPQPPACGRINSKRSVSTAVLRSLGASESEKRLLGSAGTSAESGASERDSEPLSRQRHSCGGRDDTRVTITSPVSAPPRSARGFGRLA